MYRSKSQFQFLARLMALFMLLSQGVFAFASMSAPMSHPMDMAPATDKAMTGCHNMAAMDHAQLAGDSVIDKQDKGCQNDCCDKNDCASHCQSCLNISTGVLIPVLQLVQQYSLSESLILKSDQIPNGLEPAHLYRPPRQAI